MSVQLDRLDDEHLRQAVTVYRDALRAHREHLNRLNVYPVPDGDTGTNMALTLESVAAELDGATGMAATCRAISHGSLMGARGNSGVILSQILRGLTDGLKDQDSADGATIAAGLAKASDSAYGAVMRPVEGTILTVAREAAEAAGACSTDSLVEVLDAATVAARRAVDRTPELLPVLAEAGVVDAGGAGFVLLLDALLHVTDGRAVPDPPEWAGAAASQAHAGASDHSDDDDLRYEVMYFLEAPDDAVPAFKQAWADMGDSIVIVGGEGIWNCHIHTNDVGGAIEAALDAGRPRKIRVTDLREEVEEELWVRGHMAGPDGGQTAASAAADGPNAAAGGRPTDASGSAMTAVVAVGTGDGVGRILRSLGVASIVAGGQAMNPSTRDILDAVEGAPADEVVVLPNNRNIVAVAKQVDGLTTKHVRVVETESVAEGFAALLAYDGETGADANAERMAEAAANVVTGEVVEAVRDATSPAGPVRRGDYVGITREGIVVVAASVVDAACALLELLVAEHHEIVTIIEGTGASDKGTRRISDWLNRERPAVTAEVHQGDQPLSAYLFSVE